jgi:tRNA threonylcarbamoyladenosine biosynthesis protein TsaB
VSTILGIDTSSAQGSLALSIDGMIAAERHLQAPDGFAHVLFGAIEQLLLDANKRVAEVDCFAVTSGPGGFTGLRVGLATAKGLAEANGKLCAAISTLRVLASVGKARERAVLMDARRGQVFAAVYDSGLQLTSPETVTDLREWVSAAGGLTEFIARAEFHATIRDLRPDAVLVCPPTHLAQALAQCARIDGERGWTDPALVDANYVRRSDAEMSWREH